jgi:hypothetical protein
MSFSFSLKGGKRKRKKKREKEKHQVDDLTSYQSKDFFFLENQSPSSFLEGPIYTHTH